MDLIIRHSFSHRVWLLLLPSSLLRLWGCANLIETMPPPPDFLSRAGLTGPYDRDIPTSQANSIKSASLMLDGAAFIMTCQD